MNKEDAYKVIGAVLVTIIACYGIFALLQLISISPIWSETGAAWIQAIGSMAALAVAIFVMSRQNAQARRVALEIDERGIERKLASILGFMIVCSTRTEYNCKSIKTHITTGDRSRLKSAVGYGLFEVDQLIEMLQSVSLIELGNPELVMGVMRMNRSIRFSKEVYTGIEKYESANPKSTAPFCESLDSIIKSVNDSLDFFGEGLIKASDRNSQTNKWWYHDYSNKK